MYPRTVSISVVAITFFAILDRRNFKPIILIVLVQSIVPLSFATQLPSSSLSSSINHPLEVMNKSRRFRIPFLKAFFPTATHRSQKLETQNDKATIDQIPIPDLAYVDHNDDQNISNQTIPTGNFINLEKNRLLSSSISVLCEIVSYTVKYLKQIITSTDPERYIRWTSSAVQFGLILYLSRIIWTTFSDVLNELKEQEPQQQQTIPDDFLFLKKGNELSEVLAYIQARQEEAKLNSGNAIFQPGTTHQKSNETDGVLFNTTPIASRDTSITIKKDQKHSRPTSISPPLLQLAEKLVEVGLPLRSSHDEHNTTVVHRPTVESILSKLTRSEAALLNQCLFSVSSNYQLWDNISGLHNVKERLLGTISLINPRTNTTKEHCNSTNEITLIIQDRYSSLFHGKEVGSSRSKEKLSTTSYGILLYGEPGCGKTLLIKALASITQLPCLVVTPSVLLRKYVGETNLQIRSLFSLAAKLSPCILCIDEIDGLFRERSSSPDNEHEVSRDLKTEFLQFLDGMMSSVVNRNNNKIDSEINPKHYPNRPIIVIGATNRPFDVDSAILRRLSQSHYVGLPGLEDRYDLLNRLLRQPVPTDPQLDQVHISEQTEGYSPSDIVQVLQTAVLIGPLRRAGKTTSEHMDHSGSFLTTNDVLLALKDVQPSPLSVQYRLQLANFMKPKQTDYTSGRDSKDVESTLDFRYLLDAKNKQQNSDNNDMTSKIHNKNTLRKWETNLGNFYDVGTIEVDDPTFKILEDIVQKIEQQDDVNNSEHNMHLSDDDTTEDDG